MQLKDLYQNFAGGDDNYQRHMVQQYRTRRADEFEADRIAYESRPKRGKRAPAMQLTEEEKLLMKKLGLKPAQLRALKAMEDTNAS